MAPDDPWLDTVEIDRKLLSVLVVPVAKEHHYLFENPLLHLPDQQGLFRGLALQCLICFARALGLCLLCAYNF